jgi:hypothetical protein
MSLNHSRLEVNELDPRIVPSGSPLPVKGSTSSTAQVAQQLVAHALAGLGQGTFLIPPTAFGQGTTYLLKGSANLAGLGKVTVSGSIQTPFFRTVGAITGTLTFTSSLGTVTVHLQAPAQLGSAALPHQFSYQIVSGTKGLQGVQDSGTVQLVLTIGRTSAGVRTFTYSA